MPNALIFFLENFANLSIVKIAIHLGILLYNIKIVNIDINMI